MDDELVQVLTNTQSPEQPVRQQAELALKHAQANPAFPVSLASVAAHTAIDTAIRQSALTSLRQFIEANWSPEDEYADSVVNVSEEAKGQLRTILLELTLSPEENRKVKISSRYAPSHRGSPASVCRIQWTFRANCAVSLKLRGRQDCLP